MDLQHVAKQRSLQYHGEFIAETQMYHRNCMWQAMDDPTVVPQESVYILGLELLGNFPSRLIG